MTDVLGLMQALAALAVVFALVWFGRRALAGSSLFGRRSERMQVEERIALDLRNALVIVRIEERRLLLSTSDHGPARLLAELSFPGRAAPTSLETPLSEP